MGHSVERVRRNIQLPLLAAFFIIVVAGAYAFFRLEEAENLSDLQGDLATVRAEESAFFTQQTLLLTDQLDWLMAQSEIQDAFLQKDRTRLYQEVLPIFTRLGTHQGVADATFSSARSYLIFCACISRRYLETL